MHFQPIPPPGNLEQTGATRTPFRVTTQRPANCHRAQILVADGDGQSRDALRNYLEQNGYEVTILTSGSSLEQRWHADSPDLAILDTALPNCRLARLIPELRASSPFVPLIVLAKPEAPGLAMEALRLGAEQFLLKPVDSRILGAVIQRNLEHQCLRRRRAAILHYPQPDPFSGDSEAILSLAEIARKAALTEGPVVIEGERGTGKRRLASWLHENSQRACYPLLNLNCGSLLCNRVERDEEIGLFDRQGRPLAGIPDLAHGGTIVLEELQNADLRTQAKLLQMLGKDASGSGNGRNRRGIRLIATTQHRLPGLVDAKRLRPELCSRLSGVTLQTPPLRERCGDLPMLMAQILGKLAYELGSRDFDLTREALQVLRSYSWPGNIRELRLVLERAVLLATSTLLTAADLQLRPDSAKNGQAALQFRNLREMERQYVEHVLQKVGGRVQTAAKILNVPRSSLYHKLKQYQFEREGIRSDS